MGKIFANKKGFTLVEMLACIVVLLLLCGLCTTGMNFAFKSYQESVFESESQMLESTLYIYISDLLRYSTNVECDANDVVTNFTNVSYSITKGRIGLSSDENTTEKKLVVYDSPPDKEETETLILGKNVYSTMYISSFELKYNDSTHCFEGHYTIKSTLTDRERNCSFGCRTVTELD